MTEHFTIESTQTVPDADLRDLYDSVGWSTYTRDLEVLRAAIRGSDFVVIARSGNDIIGLARAISDDASVAYIQDILVQPNHQGHGVGRALVSAVLERYRHVRQKVLLTDNRAAQIKFYESLGFSNTRTLKQTPLNAFVIIEGVSLV